MIYLYSDVLYRAGGIETYLHALALHLHREKIDFRVAVAELESCPLVDELIKQGINVYRQKRIPGDTWLLRQHMMLAWLFTQLQPGDWVFCVRQPLPALYLKTVRLVHRRRAKIAASWMLAPEFLPPTPPYAELFKQAVAETDAIISVSHCTVDQFREIYGYTGRVHVVPYHNRLFFEHPVPLPSGPPWKIVYMGRIDIQQKNLNNLLVAFATVAQQWSTVELHFYGRGPDQNRLKELAQSLKIAQQVIFHGAYDHRTDLPHIMANCHFFIYPSRFEGGPCFTLLELMQAGRFCIASDVGGIPDLYRGFPETGLLISPNDINELSNAINKTLKQLIDNRISIEKIRARYFDGFDMKYAHKAWNEVLKVDR